MMTAVLAATLALSLFLTYLTLSRVAREDATGALQRASQQLSALAEQSLAGIRARMRAAARDTAITRAAFAVQSDSAQRAPSTRSAIAAAADRLAGLLTAADTGLSVELVTMTGQRIAFAGTEPPNVSDGMSIGADRPARDRPPARYRLHRDSVDVSSLYAQRGEVLFSVVAPVVASGTTAGYLVRRYRIGAGPRAEQTIHALAGPDVAAYYHNVTGNMWTTLAGAQAATPRRIDSGGDTQILSRPGVGSVLAMEERLDGTPLVLSFERPMRAVLATPRATVMRLAALSLALILVGAAASWLISRRVTRPLAALTSASEAIASGDYDARVRLEGHDEMMRLAAAFNRMGAEVAETRQQLETQAEAAGKARALAESASRAKSDFLAVMSHELRTPLNAIAGYTELLLLGIRGPLTDLQRRDLERIRSNEQHLLGLIGAVLDLSRVEAGRVSYDLESLAVDPFLRELDALVVPQAHAKSLELEYAGSRPELRVVADREKLRQIMLNLISNAIRHTPPGGRVTLSAEANGDNTVMLLVRDTGEGVPPEARERIFEPFVQLDRSLSRSREGVGLGLAISRDLARGMGGDLTVESELRMGSTFRLELRRATESVMAPQTGLAEESRRMAHGA